ncbi:MAG: hypothetical protein A2W31_06245 [Planctomycetes bacterium RBG_16_64_10]|nr:MAG: hypothetical protein A2W31_06245 [Planctomycetes bacterium RBG_16_64_10]
MHNTRIRQVLNGTGVGAALARGAGSAFLIKMGAAGSAFVSYLVLANVLGPKAFGDYVFVLNWITTILLFAQCGLDTAALRFVASYAEQSDWAHLRGFLRRSAQLVLAAALVSAATLTVVIGLLGDRLASELRRTFLVGAPLLVALAALYVCAFQLQGLKQVIKSRLPPEVGRPLLVAGLVAALAGFAPRHVSAASTLALNLFATLLTVMVSLALLRGARPPAVRAVRAQYDTQRWIRVALALLLLTAFHQVLSRTDVLMLGSLLNTEAAGGYAIAALVSQLVLLGLGAVNVIAAPMIAELYWRGRLAELQRLVRLAAIAVLATSVPTLVVLVVFGSPVLRLFGPRFGAGYPALVVLCFGQLINALAGSVGLLMSMTGHQKQAAGIVAVAAVLNVVLNLLLIPPLGIQGAALATALTTALWNLAMLVYVSRRLQINPTLLPLAVGRR